MSTGDPKLIARAEAPQQRLQLVLGRNIRNARLQRGLTQGDVSALTGITQQHLSLIEAGRQNVTLRSLMLLAEVLKADLAGLLSWPMQRPPARAGRGKAAEKAMRA